MPAYTRFIAGVEMTFGTSSLYLGGDDSGPYDYTISTALRLGTSWYTIYTLPFVRLNLSQSCGNFALADSVTMSSCYTCTDAAVHTNVTGGTPPYTYTWSSGASASDLTDITFGTYWLTVTDTLGCTITADYVVGVDLQPCQTDGGFENVLDFSSNLCPWTTFDGDGSNTVVIPGTTFPGSGGPMSFIAFNPSTTTPAYSGASPHTGSRFAACFSSLTTSNNDWLISPHYLLAANSTVSFWVKSQNSTNGLERYVVLVSTMSNSTFDFIPISTLPYSEAPADAWTQVSYSLSAYAGQWVYIAIQCISNHGFMFMVDDFEVTPSPQQVLTCVLQGHDATCYGHSNGNINLTPIGGVTPFHYVWSNGATTQDISGLSSGTYSVTVIAANSDTTSGSATISQPPEILLTFNVTNAVGGPNGAINLTVTGGSGSYTYHWSNNSTTEDISGLPPGTFNVTVTDTLQCAVTGSAQVVLGVDEISSQSGYSLGQNYPNPFSGTTVIPVFVPGVSDVEILLYNSFGQKCGIIFKGRLDKGNHEITFNTGEFSDGTYLVMFISKDVRLRRLITIIR
ncbi:MAG: choice-of-anchor J domain-containing protein [Bacteroidia bacterium]|nr:choice-of-anchor J domain-containing protein [Bacteroidia bacterium]